MFEFGIAVGIIVALIISALVPPMSLLWISVGLGTLGAALGLPAGFVYHAKLWRALRAEGLATGGMWLRPHHLHGRLSEQRREPVVVWFAVGAVGFGLTMLGAGGVLMQVRQRGAARRGAARIAVDRRDDAVARVASRDRDLLLEIRTKGAVRLATRNWAHLQLGELA